MAKIVRVEFTYKKPGLRYDSEKQIWVGYRADVRVNGKRPRPIFKTKDEANSFVEAAQRQRKYDRAGIEIIAAPADLRISQLFKRRLEVIKNTKEKIRARRVFNQFQTTIGGDLPIRQIDTEHFQLFNNERLATGVRPATVSREDTVLSTAFKEAKSLFPLELKGYKSPEMARPKYKKRKLKDKHIITPEEKEGIIQSVLNDRLAREHQVRTLSRPIVAGMFENSWLLGLRFSECKNLLKTDLKPKARTLRVVRSKTEGVDLLEFIPDRAVEILSGHSATSKSDYIFDLPCSDHTFTDIVRRACRANGITYGRNELDGVTFHSTRHSFTTRMSQVADLATTQAYTGHSDQEMVVYYSHASKDSKRRAMERMYGSNDGKLKEIYEKVRVGEMDFEAFLKEIK
jgi:integrase